METRELFKVLIPTIVVFFIVWRLIHYIYLVAGV